MAGLAKELEEGLDSVGLSIPGAWFELPAIQFCQIALKVPEGDHCLGLNSAALKKPDQVLKVAVVLLPRPGGVVPGRHIDGSELCQSS